MPKMYKPRSDQDRLLFLQAVVKAETSYRDAGNPLLPARLFEQVQTILTALRHQYNALQENFQARGALMEARDRLTTQLDALLRGFRSGAQWRLKMYDYPPSYLGYFKIKKALPQYVPPARLLTVATYYIEGDEQAITGGYRPMSNPTAEELRTVRDDLLIQLADLKTVVMQRDRYQHEMATIRETVATLSRKIHKQVEVSLPPMPADDLRVIQRDYGYTFGEDAGNTANKQGHQSKQSNL